MSGQTATSRTDLLRWVGLVAGPPAAVAVTLLLPDASSGGLPPEGRAAAGVATLMAIWWLTEAISLSATALLPIVLFPLLGIASIRESTEPFANPLIYLFFGGFVLGLGMERWGLHRRIALLTILLVGTQPRRLIAGFMLATALMSMWVSNTATAVMMMPIGLSVIGLVFRRLGVEWEPGQPPPADAQGANFATGLMLGIAYAASIGGIGTLIGTPPNTVLAAYARDQLGIEISMARWLMVGLPLVAVFLPMAWLYLTRIAHPVRLRELPGGRELIQSELHSLGPMKRGEWIVLIVFVLTALSWILRPQLVALGRGSGANGTDLLWLTNLSDTGIAIAAALALFIIPVDIRTRTFAMDWDTARRLPWGILLLFGGGLSLAAGLEATGVTAFIGQQFVALRGLHIILIIAIVATVVIFLTELTSNTAVTTTLMPVLAGAATGLGIPAMDLLVPAAIAASCAFMLPVATPPNAIVFGSGFVTIGQMVRAGFWLNLAGVVLITGLVRLLVPIIAG